MDFWIIARQQYNVFSLGKWLDPFNHILLGDYNKTKQKVAYFQARFDEQKSEYQVEEVNGVGDLDNYMSIKKAERM